MKALLKSIIRLIPPLEDQLKFDIDGWIIMFVKKPKK